MKFYCIRNHIINFYPQEPGSPHLIAGPTTGMQHLVRYIIDHLGRRELELPQPVKEVSSVDREGKYVCLHRKVTLLQLIILH